MDIKTKSREYAITALESQIETVAKAYEDGYMQAYKEIAALPVEEDGVTYVDLGLPSGTLWSSEIIMKDNSILYRLPHAKAQVLNIPSQEQVEELWNVCKIEHSKSTIIGPNGNRINAIWTPIWIKKESDEHYNGCSCYLTSTEFKKTFTGEHLCICLVK